MRTHFKLRKRPKKIKTLLKLNIGYSKILDTTAIILDGKKYMVEKRLSIFQVFFYMICFQDNDTVKR